MSKPTAPASDESLITVFGRRAVLEALGAESVEVIGVAVARELPAEFRKELGAACRARSIEPELMTLREVAQRSGDARNDQGVAARIRLTTVLDVSALVASLKGRAAASPARVLALDNVTNPQNVGMIVRSAVAAGWTAILWPRAGAPWVSGLIIKAAASALYRCTIARCHALPEGLWELQRAGFTLYGLASGAPESLLDCAPAHRSAFIVGSETRGISPEVDALLDRRLSIPMRGGVDSLNVAVAASLVCFHAAPDRAAP